jgi:hypothetical protein
MIQIMVDARGGQNRTIEALSREIAQQSFSTCSVIKQGVKHDFHFRITSRGIIARFFHLGHLQKGETPIIEFGVIDL